MVNEGGAAEGGDAGRGKERNCLFLSAYLHCQVCNLHLWGKRGRRIVNDFGGVVRSITLKVVFRYTFDEVLEHLDQHHPGCPPAHKRRIAKRIAKKKWIATSLGRAVGLTLQKYVRHELTRYDNVLAVSAKPYDEIRAKFDRRTQAILKKWQRLQSTVPPHIASDRPTKLTPSVTASAVIDEAASAPDISVCDTA